MILVRDAEVVVRLPPGFRTRTLVFLHCADFREVPVDTDGFPAGPMRGNPVLGDVVAEYVLGFGDGGERAFPIRRRFALSEPESFTGHCFEAMPNAKPVVFTPATEMTSRGGVPSVSWGESQCRIRAGSRSYAPPFCWLYPLENPRVDADLVELRLVPREGTVFLFGVTATALGGNPLRWEGRKKAVVRVPWSQGKGAAAPVVDIDLGNVISVSPVLDYADSEWEFGAADRQPIPSPDSYIVEYAAHPEARLYLGEDGTCAVPLRTLERYCGGGDTSRASTGFSVSSLPPAVRRVKVRVVEGPGGRPVAARLHIHGAAGDYLPPMDRHRIPNPFWFEGTGGELAVGCHYAAYVGGETEVRLPVGTVYAEVFRGFETAPLRKRIEIAECTDTITLELDRVLPWRSRGWVSADTHVHFLSPRTALLEGEAEGVNVVNLLASQWGELFTNAGDFDGKTTLGSPETGGSGEYLVRVGTENRQFLLGHISLLGYRGPMILPLCSGGPTESALGDPVEEILCGWAQRCRSQDGLVILPHHPNPRAEGAAAIVMGLVDGVEMKSGGDRYAGINPFSLADWYRYLNCGYHVPAVGGTDKMEASTAVGTIRTYAWLGEEPFTYEAWMRAVRRGHTFATYGPLIDFHVGGVPMGGAIDLPDGGGTLDIDWTVASVTVPVTAVELVVNGETRGVRRTDPAETASSGTFSQRMGGGGWAALRIRGRYPGRPEMIAAHSSAVMVRAGGRSCFRHPDALSILEQIEGATAYVRSLGTRAEDAVYSRLLMTLTAAHRSLHNRMHREGFFHGHAPAEDHHGRGGVFNARHPGRA